MMEAPCMKDFIWGAFWLPLKGKANINPKLDEYIIRENSNRVGGMGLCLW